MIDRPAVIVGCGPSAEAVEWNPERYTLCAVNDAVRLCDRVDVLAVNDTPALDRVADRFDVIGTLLLPRYLHDDPAPKSTTFWLHALNHAIGESRPSNHFDVCTYRLHTDPMVDAKLWQASFGRCRSTSDSLIAWLLCRGYRRFHTLGIEWDGASGSHPSLPAGHHKSAAHRMSIWQHTLDRINLHGGHVERGVPK